MRRPKRRWALGAPQRHWNGSIFCSAEPTDAKCPADKVSAECGEPGKSQDGLECALVQNFRKVENNNVGGPDGTVLNCWEHWWVVVHLHVGGDGRRDDRDPFRDAVIWK